MQRDTVEIVNPVAQREVGLKKVELAQRRSDLGDQVIGLLANPKPNADKFLEIVSGLLKERLKPAGVIFKRKASWTQADCLPELIEKCDTVITAFAD